jgi:hypothetical protein
MDSEEATIRLKLSYLSMLIIVLGDRLLKHISINLRLRIGGALVLVQYRLKMFTQILSGLYEVIFSKIFFLGNDAI